MKFQTRKKTTSKQMSWGPTDQRFYQDVSSDEEDSPVKINKNIVWTDQLEEEIKQELEWDSNDEHLQLGHSPTTEEDTLQDILEPRQLFEETNNSDNNSASLTEESSDDNVFINSDQDRPVQQPKLKRRNAMKRMRKRVSSEPRITRKMLRSGHLESISNPTSPSNVLLHRVQNLESILLPRVPLIPDVVDMKNATVQVLHNVLNIEDLQVEDNTRRQSRLRAQPKINYQLFHEYGRKY